MIDIIFSKLGYVRKDRVHKWENNSAKLIKAIKKIAKNCSSLHDNVKLKQLFGKEIRVKGVVKKIVTNGPVLIKYPVSIDSYEIIADHIWVEGWDNIQDTENSMVDITGIVTMRDRRKYSLTFLKKNQNA